MAILKIARLYVSHNTLFSCISFKIFNMLIILFLCIIQISPVGSYYLSIYNTGNASSIGLKTHPPFLHRLVTPNPNKMDKIDRQSTVDPSRGRHTQVTVPSCRLLQGLVTNDLRELGEKKKDGESYQKIALFTLFLQPKGKVLTDAFIFIPRVYKNGKPKYAEE